MKKKKREYEENLYYDEQDDDDEIEIMDFIFLILQNWKLVIGTMIPVVILGLTFAMTRPNIYKSEATLMVSSGQVYTGDVLDNSEITRNQKLVTTYTQIAKSKTIMRNVINKLDLDMTPKEVAKLVQVTPVEETEFIKISYKDKNARRAALLVNEVSTEFMEQVQRVMKVQNLSIMEKAVVADQPESKKRALILAISIVLGGFLGVFIVILMEMLHSKVRKPKEIEKILGCSVLASLPDFSEDLNPNDKKKKEGEKKEATKREIFFNDNEDSHLAESLRVLRTNIHFMEESNNRTIVFTSTIPKEGKSTVAANYAMSVAISGERVILIDCDIRRPRAHTGFGLEFDKGLGDVLKGDVTLDEAIIKDVEKGLDMLPSKHINKNATELFLGEKMKATLDELKSRYDLIVLDNPPVAVATDAVILSEHADGLVYVVGYDMVSKKELEQSKKLFDRAGTNVYGVVVNKIQKKAYSYGNYGYYNNNYGYYQEYIKGDK